METVSVNVENLRLGKTIAEDIFANTQYPIIRKDTKINHEHLHVFKAFNITKVPVLIEEGDSSLDSLENSSSEIGTTNEQLSITVSFEKMYNQAVSKFKRDFRNWEA